MPTGRARVMDFGLARSVEMIRADADRSHARDASLHVAGTGERRAVDPRSEMFSLGIIFYELLTGVMPFKADTLWGTVLSRTQKEPPPAVSASIRRSRRNSSEIAAKCLSHRSRQRYAGAREMGADLD